MTNQEFSSEFDILYNNIMSNQAPGLDEYEKSVFLTKAQEAFILEAYTGNFNDAAFEGTELVSEFLSALIRQYSTDTPLEGDRLDPRSVLYKLPSDLWLIVYEQVKLIDDSLLCKNNKNALVVPITHDEYYKIIKNPFRGPGDSQVLRLKNGDNAELISKYTLGEYVLRYIIRPSPIILTDLSEYNVSIDNITEEMECSLSPIVHRLILNKAVEFAKSSMSSK